MSAVKATIRAVAKTTTILAMIIAGIWFIFSTYTANLSQNYAIEALERQQSWQRQLINYNQNDILFLVGQMNKVYDHINDANVTIVQIEKSLQENQLKVIQQLREQLSPNVVTMLKGDVFVAGMSGVGAGTVIKQTDKAFYVISCAHVVEDIIQLNERGIQFGATVGYTKIDGDYRVAGLILYGAEIVKYNIDEDLVLLKVNTVDEQLNEIKIAEEPPEKGDTVYSVGSPLGMFRTISKGILSNTIDKYYISDNTATFGNSGGGLYNYKAELVGIPSNVMGYSVGEDSFAPESGLGLSITLKRIKAFLEGVEF